MNLTSCKTFKSKLWKITNITCADDDDNVLFKSNSKENETAIKKMSTLSDNEDSDSDDDCIIEDNEDNDHERFMAYAQINEHNFLDDFIDKEKVGDKSISNDNKVRPTQEQSPITYEVISNSVNEVPTTNLPAFYNLTSSENIYQANGNFTSTNEINNSTACMNLPINSDVLSKKYQNGQLLSNQTGFYTEVPSTKHSQNHSQFSHTSYVEDGMGGVNYKYYPDLNNNMHSYSMSQGGASGGIENIPENFYATDSNYQYNSSYLNNYGSLNNQMSYYYNDVNTDENNIMSMNNNNQLNDSMFNNQNFIQNFYQN